MRNIVLALCLAVPGVALATGVGHSAHHASPGTSVAESAGLADGEVRKVDKGSGTVTLKHGPLPGIGMPAMTMDFRVKEPGRLNGLKSGDRIRFKAEMIEGAPTVTEFQPAS